MGPYMHDGSARTLEEVVEFYDKGGMKNPHLSKKMTPLGLTAQEKADLVEFLRALTGDIALEVLPRSCPNSTWASCRQYTAASRGASACPSRNDGRCCLRRGD